MDNIDLIKKAKSVSKVIKHNEEFTSGEVGCALISSKNKLYFGVNLNCACGIGVCAEGSAISTMVTKGETKINKIVAVDSEGRILPPCGRCRELIYQINNENRNTEVIISQNKIVKLIKLLNYPWQDVYK